MYLYEHRSAEANTVYIHAIMCTILYRLLSDENVIEVQSRLACISPLRYPDVHVLDLWMSAAAVTSFPNME